MAKSQTTAKATNRMGLGRANGESTTAQFGRLIPPASDAPERPPPLSFADQTRRSAITVAAMGFLVAGLLLLTIPTPVTPKPSTQLGFRPKPSLFVTYSTAPRSAAPHGALVGKVLLQGSVRIPFHHGDVIIGCDHQPIATAPQLTRCLTAHRIGQVINIDYVHDRAERHADVQLTAGP